MVNHRSYLALAMPRRIKKESRLPSLKKPLLTEIGSIKAFFGYEWNN